MQHRSGFGGEDQYHLSLTTDTYLGNKILDTPKRQKWAELCETKGFGIYTGNKYWYDIGKAEANYNVLNIAGIYQCFLHHFHNFPTAIGRNFILRRFNDKTRHLFTNSCYGRSRRIY